MTTAFTKQRFILQIIIVFGWVMGLNACHSDAAPLSDPPVANWQLSLTMSGGFAGFYRQLRLSDNGKMVINDLKMKKSIEKQLDKKSLQSIHEFVTTLLARPHKKSVQKLVNKCADCIIYTLVVNGYSGMRIQRYAQAEINQPRALKPLLDSLH